MSETTIATPDTSELQPRILALQELGSLKITDDASLQAAKEGLDACADLEKHPVVEKVKKACTDANTLHKSLTALRDGFLVPIKRVDVYLRGGIARYLDEQERKRKEVERQLQEQAKAAQQQALEEAEPWEEPPAPVAPTVSLAPAPAAVPGLSLRKLPKKAQIVGFQESGVYSDGFKALVVAAAKGLQKSDDSLLAFLLPNETALSSRAREWPKDIFEERIPGVIVIDDQKTVSRR